MKIDLASFLNQKKELFTDSGLEKVTGLNSEEIQDYATGNKNPTIAKLKKIENAIHCFGQEILNELDDLENIKTGLEEMKLFKKGELKTTLAKDFLNEL
jgi:transcriptional regulator with XRE-family HTH domain